MCDCHASLKKKIFHLSYVFVPFKTGHFSIQNEFVSDNHDVIIKYSQSKQKRNKITKHFVKCTLIFEMSGRIWLTLWLKYLKVSDHDNAGIF